jgi:hypothetical protein
LGQQKQQQQHMQGMSKQRMQKASPPAATPATCAGVQKQLRAAMFLESLMQAATSRLKVHGRDDFPEHFKLPMIGNASGGAIDKEPTVPLSMTASHPVLQQVM